MKYPYIFVITMSIFLVACGSPSEPLLQKSVQTDILVESSAVIDINLSDSGSQVVATIGNQSINLSELDDTMLLALFDLEWRKYELRKEMLGKLIAHRQISEVELETAVLLQPPLPPRLEIPADKRPARGSVNASVSLAIFCSFQSSHCARLQPVIKQLEQHYGDAISLRFYDLPQRFHRYAVAAANASHCASEFKQPWRYMDSLYSDISSLDKNRFMTISEQLGFDQKQFELCLDESRYFDNIKADMAFADQLGLGNVPVVFINGLYTKGPKTFDAYQYYVEQELTRLGEPLKHLSQKAAIESQLSFILTATTVSNDSSKSTALIKLEGNAESTEYRVGSQLLDYVELVGIDERTVMLNNRGQLEFLRLSVSEGHELLVVQSDLASQGAIMESMREARNDSELGTTRGPKSNKRSLPSAGEMTLSKEWLQNQLIGVSDLKAYFHNAEHVVEGHHLVKLDNIDDHRFYNTLGLKSGDVLMRVNDQWVHDGSNPLWETLESGEPTKIILMRKGLPVRYDYTVR